MSVTFAGRSTIVALQEKAGRLPPASALFEIGALMPMRGPQSLVPRKVLMYFSRCHRSLWGFGGASSSRNVARDKTEESSTLASARLHILAACEKQTDHKIPQAFLAP